MSKTTAFIHKEVKQQVQALHHRGGQWQIAAQKVKAVLYDLTNKSSDPISVFGKIPVTNHGESRIKHCVKYDFAGFTRLVTIQNNGWIVLLYFGNHDEVDRWLENNKGLQVAISDAENGLFEVFKSSDITDAETRVSPEGDLAVGNLYIPLKHYYEEISKRVTGLVKRTIESFTTLTEEEEILEASLAISEIATQELVFDVFMLLRAGKVDEAKNRVLIFQEELRLLNEVPMEEIEDVRSNDQFIKIDELDAQDMRILMDNKDWLEWMLFMHPAQKAVVNQSFSGSARLLGVSGSGKTCVVVRRAVMLAQKYPGEKILILTLNQSLSNLIEDLTTNLIEIQQEPGLSEQIEIKSFWELCRDLIIELRQHPLDQRILSSRSDKHNESVDEIWEEFYRCENNNHDAEILTGIHGMLLSRGIYPQDYIKQEFDWIRSFLSTEEKKNYLTIEREGRTVPLQTNEREVVLDGLKCWEQKMNDIGVIDYLGLANELCKYYQLLTPRYRCILVDEMQDFGTLELKIIRKLAEEGANDLFLTGDIAQQVYTKHHKIRNAGIHILPEAYLRILKNYRNSREILSAAHEMFKANTKEEQYKSEDFELLKPEYANFSSPKPFLRRGKSLSDELSSALSYLTEILGEKEKGCITICGYSLYDVQHLGNDLSIPVLDGICKVGEEKIYLSDLDQTKGFEFDRMIIINAKEKTIPDHSLPSDEWYRDISKLYVAMTRAKKELVISYSSEMSSLFDYVMDFFTRDSWSDHLLSERTEIVLPKSTRIHASNVATFKVKGKDFLYDKRSLGISRELQNKIVELVAGKTIDFQNKRLGWANMEDLRIDVLSKRNIPHLNGLFGPAVYRELERLFTQ